MSPITRRRLAQFKANKRGFWSLWLFLALFVFAMAANFIANDKPLLVKYDGSFYMPIFKSYTETAFGGDFETEAAYRDPYVIDLIKADGWILWAPIPYSYDTVNKYTPAPSPYRPF